jgi:2,4-dienoyl-CoA reductase-like NADH-dependent reductase (Old Yellow Enzyme family)
VGKKHSSIFERRYSDMPALFEETALGSLVLANRFVRSATFEGLADEKGDCSGRLIDLYTSLAKGGVGLIITGHAYVRRDGQASPRQNGFYDESRTSGYRTLTEAVHKLGGKIAIQLSHAGVYAYTKQYGFRPVAVSENAVQTESEQRELSKPDIQELAADFAKAAQGAADAGFDGVQIHAAHGYLLSQFLSPLFNRRTDEYGGTVVKRARLLVEVVETIRERLGDDYPVLVKMNCSDFNEGGLRVEEAVGAAEMAQDAGVDAIELSGGLLTSRRYGPTRRGIDGPDKEAYFHNESKIFKSKLSIPLILVGGIRSYGVAEKLVGDEVCNLISMCRPLIREPDLINRWRLGDSFSSDCISDNRCFKPALHGDGVLCVHIEK